MIWTQSAVKIPGSQTVVLLLGIFLTPALFGGGGSPSSAYSLITNNFKISSQSIFISQTIKI